MGNSIKILENYLESIGKFHEGLRKILRKF